MEDYFQMINKNRDIANDLCKGLAILLVIVGHILPMHHYLRVWIYTFHMPLFFFLAGMTYKPRPIGELISNSIKRLLVPFAICMLGAICLHLLSCDFEMVLARSVGFIFPDGLKYSLWGYCDHRANAAALWFLVALFWSRIYFNKLYSCFPKTYVFLSLGITLLCGYIGKYGYNLPFSMLIGGCAVGYTASGKWYSENSEVIRKMPLWAWLCFIPIWLFAAYRFYFEMYGFNYQKKAYIVGIVIAILASVFIYSVMQVLIKKVNPQWYKWLQWCGYHSLTILICHFFAQEIIIALKMFYQIPHTKAALVVGTFGLILVWYAGKKCLKFTKRYIQNSYYKSCRYDYCPTNNGWQKYPGNPVLGDIESGTVFDPYVFINRDNLNMLYSKRDNGSLVLASSRDGIAWGNQFTVLSGRRDEWDAIVNRGCMIKRGEKWQLWYTGQNNGKSSIGYAESVNGKDFERINNHPIILANLRHEGVSVMNPCVIWDEKEKKYKMWYAAGEDYEPDVICYAESHNGIEWAKHNTPVLTPCYKHAWEKYKVGGCDVRLENGIYTMYYIGYQNINVARICCANSNDGINWRRLQNNLLISPSEGEWDADACYKPTVISWHRTLMLYYNGRQNTIEYIGLATKKISEQ